MFDELCIREIISTNKMINNFRENKIYPKNIVENGVEFIKIEVSYRFLQSG